MYAVIETGGKQYRVQEGDVITVEKLKANAGEDIQFDKVLVLGNGSDVKIGAPYLDAAKVFGTVVENGKGQKVIIFKYKSKKDYRKKQGHRQPYTMVKIEGLSASGDAPAKKTAMAVDVAEAKADAAEENDDKKNIAKPSLKSMKKAELITFAQENNIEINEKATNAEIIASIEAILK